MSIQSVRSVAVGLPTASPQAQPSTPAPVRSSPQARKARSSEDENVFAPPGVMSRLVRSMRSDEVMRVEAVSRGSELSASKGYPSDTVVSAIVQQMLSGS